MRVLDTVKKIKKHYLYLIDEEILPGTIRKYKKVVDEATRAIGVLGDPKFVEAQFDEDEELPRDLKLIAGDKERDKQS